MKKIIGVLGVAVIAATMFFSANNVNGSNSDASLAGLMGLNNANAEGGTTIGSTDCTCKETTCQDANWISFRDNCGNVPGHSSDKVCALYHANACN